MLKLPSGASIKVAKSGFLQTPTGRYVRDTVQNRLKYYPAAEYAEGTVGPAISQQQLAAATAAYAAAQ